MRKISECYENLSLKQGTIAKGTFYVKSSFRTISCGNKEICFDSLENLLYIEKQRDQLYRRIKPTKHQS